MPDYPVTKMPVIPSAVSEVEQVGPPATPVNVEEQGAPEAQCLTGGR